MNTCTIDGCQKPARTKSAALCKMHYHRQYRSGSAGEAAERKRKQRSPDCHVEGCNKPDTAAGLCSMHETRNRRHGNPLAFIAIEDRAYHSGEDNHNWVGQSIGYTGAHDRVRAIHGPASGRPCVDCGSQAMHWSYNHDDPAELLVHGLSANPIAYSDSPGHYSARCVPCHKAFDLDRTPA